MFASATRISIVGLRISIPPSLMPGLAAVWTCRLMMTLLTPMISNRRKDPLSHSGRVPEPLRAAGRMLSWHQTELGRKIAGLVEGLRGREARTAMAVAISGPMPHCLAGHVYTPEKGRRHQSFGRLVLLGSMGDFGIKLPYF
jgi:hypothetical protein